MRKVEIKKAEPFEKGSAFLFFKQMAYNGF